MAAKAPPHPSHPPPPQWGPLNQSPYRHLAMANLQSASHSRCLVCVELTDRNPVIQSQNLHELLILHRVPEDVGIHTTCDPSEAESK